MKKGRTYRDYLRQGSQRELDLGLGRIEEEVKESPLFIKEATYMALNNFRLGRFNYEASTLIKYNLKNSNSYEAANLVYWDMVSQGYTGYNVKLFCIIIMLVQKYPKWLIVKESLLYLPFEMVRILKCKYFKKNLNSIYQGDIELKNYIK
jgi:hypothetical protein